MSGLRLPVVGAGPGSQDDEAPDYLPMPSDMATFRPPSSDVLAGKPRAATRAAHALLSGYRDALAAWRLGQPCAPRLELGDVPADVLEVINQALGQGEVSAMIQRPRAVRIQETAFAGIWRVQWLDAAGAVERDLLEAGDVPAVVRGSLAATFTTSVAAAEPPAGLMNSPVLLREILDHAAARRDSDPAHVINLTLLPVTPEDLGYLHDALGVGAVTILSRGYGNCRISGAAVGGVWWVQYFNSMDQLILDTIEVVGVPEVALAAREDLADTTVRLGEWLEMLLLEAQA